MVPVQSSAGASTVTASLDKRRTSNRKAGSYVFTEHCEDVNVCAGCGLVSSIDASTKVAVAEL